VSEIENIAKFLGSMKNYNNSNPITRERRNSNSNILFV